LWPSFVRLHSLDELQHESESGFDVRFEEEMAAVEDVRFHSRQIFHPGHVSASSKYGS
jgi:hypothetical protein